MYKIVVYSITPSREEKGYDRENSQEIYSQRLEVLDLKAVIGAVNVMIDAQPQWVVSGVQQQCEQK